MPVEVPLTRGAVALVDEEDLPKIAPYKWYLGGKPGHWEAATCVRRNGRGATIKMHRLITDAPPAVEVDHINHDSLENRRANLRFVNRSENGQNRRGAPPQSRTGVRNVSWDARRRRYRVVLMVQQRYYNCGSFRTLEEATAAAQAARARLMTHADPEQH